jgi:hypothetical protein
LNQNPIVEPDPAPEALAAASERLGDNDHGVLPEPTRRVLVQLLQGPYVSRSAHPRRWATLAADEAVIRSRLGDLFLELVLDQDVGIGFVRNLSVEGVDVPRVIRRTSLTLIDTALVLQLRQQLLTAEAAAGRAFIGRDEINEHLEVYRQHDRADPATFAKRVETSVNKMKDHSLLLATGEEGRFEVSPILKLVFAADEVQEVTRQLLNLLSSAGSDPVDEPETEEV